MARRTVEGTEEVDRDFTGYMAGLKRGETYSPRGDRATRASGCSISACSTASAVTEADALDDNGQIPISVEVSERKKRYYGIGATYSNTEGIGIEGYWGHRNLFGRAEKLRIEGSISRFGDTIGLRQAELQCRDHVREAGRDRPAVEVLRESRGGVRAPRRLRPLRRQSEASGVAYDLDQASIVSAESALEYADIDDGVRRRAPSYRQHSAAIRL